MAEVYPSDNDLLNIQTDAETGVEYIPTGTAPYYLQFRRLLYRLLLATQRANDLRVYDEGGLDIGVKPGKFWLGTERVSYEGSSGNTLADDREDIYIYLDSSGSLVVDEYSSFPNMATTPHIRLARVSTSGGDIESITDCRAGHNVVMPSAAGGLKKTIEAHTSDDTLTGAESGSVHSNLGATTIVTLTLPASASAGTVFNFAVQAAQQLRVDPGTAAIRDDSGQTADKYKKAATIGASLTLVADENGNWATLAKNGTWTEEA
ncbi:MAG: hypothetical protein A2Z25_11855 [Planctomycetes bacterium RBG_16_55_9]|nr:MAG: hypothetical protein A2Z25_11855 [Planctomycetes bacterium RBG_16_55_9]